MSGWVDAAALMETRDAPLFVQTLEQRVSSLDATYWCEDHLLVDLPSVEDEVWFRLAFMNEITLREMNRFAEQRYLVPPRHFADVEGWIADGLFEAMAVPFTVAHLELRDEAALRELEAGLAAGRQSFIGCGALLWQV